ncbi:MAG TPA: SRPBCC domain-containing protein [Anaerolineales bacterium]
MDTRTVSLTQTVKASPEEVYRNFTNATALREWLCDAALALPHPGGRLYLSWNHGYYASGEYTANQPGEKVAFTWQGRGEPAPTRVQVDLAAQDGGTRVTLEHSSIGSGDEWEKAYHEIQEGWQTGLENLASILETGEDPRFVRRPMLGILLENFDAKVAQEMGLPVTEGIRLGGTLEGMGAHAAGLQKNDVIVSMGGQPLTDYNSLAVALQKQHAGDEVEVVYYRGSEKRTVPLRFSKRPIPEIPETAEGLGEAVREINAEVEARLDQFLEGVTEEEASFKLSSNDWSIKENIAHLLQGERYNHFYIAELVFGEERFSDGYGDNLNAQVAATADAYPTLRDLREELRRNSAETVGMLSRLAKEFGDRKASYWRLAYEMLQPQYHLDTHIEQMQATLDAAREAAGAVK